MVGLTRFSKGIRGSGEAKKFGGFIKERVEGRCDYRQEKRNKIRRQKGTGGTRTTRRVRE